MPKSPIVEDVAADAIDVRSEATMVTVAIVFEAVPRVIVLVSVLEGAYMTDGI